MDPTPSRCARIRALFRETQPQFALRLRTSQQTISRIETGGPESGPLSLVLDLIEADIAAGIDVTAEGYRIGFPADAEKAGQGFRCGTGEEAGAR
jgi:transcriptional regulator with XRE-family HTH domain